MDWRWRLLSLSTSPMVATIESSIQTEGEAMQAVTHNGSAEHRVAQALEAEKVIRAPRVNWPIVAEVFFVGVALAAMVWSLWR